MKKIIITALLASSTLPVLGADAEHPVSLELLIGKAETTTDVARSGEAEDDESSLGGRFTFAFSDFIALETGYMKYGEASDSYIDRDSNTVRNNIETSSINIGLKASAPLSEYFSLSLRAGAAIWQIEADEQRVLSLQPQEVTDDGIDPYYGFGAEFQIDDRLIIGAEYTILDAELSDGNFEADHKIKNIALVLGFQF